MKKSFRERIIEIMDEKNITQAEISRITNITQSSLSDYIKGKYAPKQDKIDLIARAVGVSPSYLMGYDEPEEPSHYYTDPEARELANQIYQDDNLRILFDAAKDVSADEIKAVVNILEQFKKTRR